MSEYTVVYAKDPNSDFKVEYVCLCTSASRELALPYTNGEEREFTMGLCDEAKSHYEEDIRTWEDSIKRKKRRIETLKETAAKASSPDVVKKLLDDIDENDASIEACLEYIEESKDMMRMFGFIRESIDSNKEKVKFVYYRG